MWVPITIFAALAQTSRTAAQQRLRSLLSVNGAGFVRYAYGAPVAVSAVGVIVLLGHRLPVPPPRFWPIVLGAGLAQILGTNALIRSFDLRNFAVGTVYAKTEVVQVGVFSAVLLGEPLQPLGWVGVAVVMVGVTLLVLSGAPGGRVGRSGGRDRAAVIGILAGGLFGLAAVGIRAASRSLGDHPTVVARRPHAGRDEHQPDRDAGWIPRRAPARAAPPRRAHWRSSSVVGLLSVMGSAGWAIAVTLQNAARVRTVGQVELLFTFAASRWWLREQHSAREYWASGLVVLGVIGVIVAG